MDSVLINNKCYLLLPYYKLLKNFYEGPIKARRDYIEMFMVAELEIMGSVFIISRCYYLFN